MGSPWTARALVASCLALSLAAPAAAQSIAVDRQRGEQMLDQIREDLVEHYYDPTFHGIDLDGLIDRARQRINAAQSLGEIFGLLAGVCLDLHDSHTLFMPPERVQDVRYGWSWRYVGDRALVDWIADDSEARRQGLRAGDTVLEVAGFTLTRGNERTISYLLSELRPQPQLRLTVERNGVNRTLTVAPRIRTRRPRLDLDNQLDRYVAEMQEATANAGRPKPKQERLADGALYWRLPDFFDAPGAIRKQAKTLRRSHRLVLDLRGNPGGSVGVLVQVAGLFAAKGTPVVSIRTRADREKMATADAAAPYAGTVVVLVDSRSGSSAEVLARFLQQRGARVVGDVTRGAVTGARVFNHAAGEGDIRVLYAVMVTVLDVLMPDGSRLEGAGVQPDILSLPTPDDLERGADPVLATAAALLDVTIDPLRAGRLSRP
ncbi:MAG: S41 family peptidase [Vicinamibacteraceae bacterium]